VYVNRNVVNIVPTGVSNLPLINNLLQPVVYPNPVSNNSFIEFTLEKRTNVQIDLFNYSGQKINSVYNGTLSKGRQTIPLFNSNNYLKTGAGYFVKIITTEGFGTVKFIAVK